MSRFKNLSSGKLWSVVGAVLYFLCFPPFNLYFVSIFVMPAFLFSIESMRSKRDVIKLSMMASALIAIGGFHWIINAAQSILHLQLWASVCVFALFSLFAAPQVYLFFGLGSRYFQKIRALPVLLQLFFWPTLYVSIEFLSRELKIFPEQLGATLVNNLQLAQAASLGGASLLSFLPLMIGTSIYLLHRNGKRALSTLALSLIFVSGFYFWGSAELDRLKNQTGKLLRVGLIQHGPRRELVPALLRGSDPEALDLLIRQYLELSKLAKKVDLLVWPETAYPMTFPARASVEGNRQNYYANLLFEFTRNSKTALLFGAYELQSKQQFNSGILIDAEGGAAGSYRKNLLLIFGERMPFLDWFPSLNFFLNEFGAFTPGEGPHPLRWNKNFDPVLLGINICYEDIMPQYMRLLAANGAEIFVNLSNDDWSRSSIEQRQHLQLAILTAIENRRPLVRATKTGVSAFVTPYGEILAQVTLNQPGVLVRDVIRSNETSLYLKVGELFSWAAIALTVSLLVFFHTPWGGASKQ